MKLSRKLLLLLLVVGVTPLLATLSLVHWHTAERVVNHTLVSVERLVQVYAEEISGFFDARVAEITAYAHTPVLKSMDWEAVGPFLKDQVGRHRSVYEKFIVGLPEGHFRNTKVGNPHRGWLASFDDSDPESRLKSIVAREYWQELVGSNALGEHRAHVSDPMISYTTGVRQVVVGASVISESEGLVGMLGGAVPWEVIEALLVSIQSRISSDYGLSARLALIDSDGTYIYHWDSNKIVRLDRDKSGQPVLDERGEKRIISHNIQDEADQKNAVAGRLAIGGRTGHMLLDGAAGAEPAYVIYAPVAAAQYGLLLWLPESAVLEIARQEEGNILIIAGITCALIILTALVVSRLVSSRIEVLSKASGRLSRGELDIYIPETGSDEITELTRSFNHMTESLRLRDEKLRSELLLRRQAEDEALHDGLTGLYNRRYLDKRLEEETRRADRTGQAMSILMIDIDCFKVFNDHAGHLAGDDAIRAIASKLESNFHRPADMLARYGGEEFCAVLPETDTAGAARFAEKIRQSLEKLKLDRKNADSSPWFTVSVGVAGGLPASEGGIQGLLDAADKALFDAKQAGRNCVRVGTGRARIVGLDV